MSRAYYRYSGEIVTSTVVVLSLIVFTNTLFPVSHCIKNNIKTRSIKYDVVFKYDVYSNESNDFHCLIVKGTGPG